MNFFKKMLGMSGGLSDKIKTTRINGTLYRIIKDARNIIFQQCEIQFCQEQQKDYFVKFTSKLSEAEQRQYAFPIHSDMQLVSFFMNKNKTQNACFEWQLDETQEHIGCYMNPKDKEEFKEIICQLIKIVLNDQLIQDHLKLCKQLSGIPIYADTPECSKISGTSSKISAKSVENQLNDTLLKEACEKSNKMANTASLYEIYEKQRTLVNEAIVFIIKETSQFHYDLQLINATGYCFKQKYIDPALVYEVNFNESYLKWLHIETKQQSKIIEVNFNGKKDVAMSVKFAIEECLYETKIHKKMVDMISEDEVQYLKSTSENNFDLKCQEIVKSYDHKQQINEIEESKFIYNNQNVDKGLQKYRTLCQAKVDNFDLASVGSAIQTLKITEDNQIKCIDHRKIPQYKHQSTNIDKIVLGDKDSKAMLNDEKGNLHYYDLQTGAILNSYEISKAGIQDICPEYKIAETTDYKTYKGISPNTIYQIDPRTKEGQVNLKSYQTNPMFNKISVDSKGRFACSSTNGEIRLFPEIGKNTNCKYPGFGDPVLHLESTKDGKWLLATFKSYLMLIPTETEDQVSLYEEKIKTIDRPHPIRLKIKLEHLQLCGVKDYQMVPAKFDESKYTKQMFIVSGFGEYVVLWNLSKIVKGNIDDYKFTKINGELVQAQFKYDNIRKLILTTTNGITVRQNKIKM